MAGVQPSLLYKISEGPFVHECVNSVGAVCVIIEIVEIHLEKMHFLLDLLEDDLVVPVVAGLHKNSGKK
jgi:hypothetical protein